MEDNELDKLLSSYKVADADKGLLDGIVSLAKGQPANENTRAALLRNAAMLSVAALLGFWLGNATIPAQHGATLTGVTVTNTNTNSTVQRNYLDRMIMGPGSLDEMRL